MEHERIKQLSLYLVSLIAILGFLLGIFDLFYDLSKNYARLSQTVADLTLVTISLIAGELIILHFVSLRDIEKEIIKYKSINTFLSAADNNDLFHNILLRYGARGHGRIQSDQTLTVDGYDNILDLW